MKLSVNSSIMSVYGTILYIHGMGGGADSRIPSILRDCFPDVGNPEIVIRTYDFNPDLARTQISSWMDELHPDILVGESLGAVHALYARLPGMPVILVSPALNAPTALSRLSFLTFIPGVSALADRIYRPRPGNRQSIHFSRDNLRGWADLRRDALVHSGQESDITYAFFGDMDHYRRMGIVSVRTWKRFFGQDSLCIYHGTHFMEEEHVRSILKERIILMLKNCRCQ